MKITFAVIVLVGFVFTACARTDSVFICKSSGAVAFHSRFCYGLKGCTHPIVKVIAREAVRLGYRACKICYRKSELLHNRKLIETLIQRFLAAIPDYKPHNNILLPGVIFNGL